MHSLIFHKLYYLTPPHIIIFFFFLSARCFVVLFVVVYENAANDDASLFVSDARSVSCPIAHPFLIVVNIKVNDRESQSV